MKFKKSPSKDMQPLSFALDQASAVDRDHATEQDTLAEFDTASFISPFGGSRAVTEKVSKREEMIVRYAYPAAAVLSVIWAACIVTFAISYNTPDWAFDFQPVQIALLVIVAVAPTALLALTAYSIRQSAQLTAEAQRARASTDSLVAPVILAAGITGNVVENVKSEIEKAMHVAAEASQQLTVLRLALSQESERMSATVADAERAARMLTESLGHERLEMGVLSAELDQRAAAVAGSIQRQAKMVAEASDLAQTQVREAEATLAARTADLASAAADAGELSAVAGQQMAINADRLETVGNAVNQQLTALWSEMSGEREQLQAVSESLRSDHAAVASMLETQRSQLLDAIAHARVGSNEIHTAATTGAEALRSLIAEAAAQVGSLAETARAEQESMEAQARARLKLFASVVAEERAAIEADSRAAIDSIAEAAEDARTMALEKVGSERFAVVAEAREAIDELTRAADEARAAAQGQIEAARDAAAAHTDAARNQMDQLSEAAFATGQRADQIYDARLAAARRLIEDSTRLVEEAGLRSAQKIEVGLTATRDALGELETLLAEVDARAGRLPSEAHASVEAVRDAISRGVEELTSAARRAAEETQVIDAAFQDRVRRNYEMLSESVRLMTQVAGTSETTARAQPEQIVLKTVEPAVAPPEIAAAVERARTEAATASAAAAAQEAPRIAVGAGGGGSMKVERPAPPPRRAPRERGGDSVGPPLDLSAAVVESGLRPRLRLTPTEPVDDVKTVFQPARSERKTREDDGDWTWRDLLKNVDGGERSEDSALATRLMSEIETLGIDTHALLPRTRVEEITRALSEGDLDAGRDAVRRLAPAAVRRLSRRMEAEPTLRREAEQFAAKFGDLVVDALARGLAPASGLLGSDQGRIFLLLDAAVSQKS